MAAKLELVISAVDKFSGVFGDLEKQGSNLGGNLAGFGAKAALAFTGAGVAVGGLVAITGFGFNQMREQAQIAFETMLGSGEKAKTFLDELQAFAAKTPFEFPELVRSSQKLLAMGFSAEKVIPTLTAIGDAAAALGAGPQVMDQITRALGQMQAKGKASAEEMLQLSEAGIPAWQFLADAIGTDVPGAMEKVRKGAVDSETVITAVTTGMNERFGGMMDKQSRTFGGVLSTLKDTFTQLSGAVMAPFFEMATSGLLKLSELTASPDFQAGAEKVAAAISSGLGAAFRFLAANGPKAFAFIKEDILPALRQVVPQIIDFGRVALNLGMGIAQFLAPALDTLADLWRNALGPALQAVAPIAEKVGQFLLQHKEILVGLAVAILLITNPWLAVVAVLLVVLAKWDEISQFFTTTIPAAIDSVLNKIREIPIIGPIFEDTWNTVVAIVETALDLIWNRIKFALDTIKNMFAFWKAIFTGDWGAAWDALKAQAKAVWDLISGDFGALLDGFVAILGSKLDLLKGVGEDIGGAIGDGLEVGESLVKGALNGIIAAVEKGLNFIIDAINKFNPTGSIGSAFNAISGVFGGPKIPSLSIPHVTLTRLQQGGFVPAGAVVPAILHGPEAVIPLNRMPASGAGGGMTLVLQPGAIVFNGSDFRDPVEFERVADRLMGALQRRMRMR